MKIVTKLIFYGSLLISSLLIDSRNLYANKKFNLTGINLGIYEKGPYIGVFSDLDKKNQLEVGVNYLNIPIGNYDANFSEPIQANISFLGLRLISRRYIQNTNDSGIFTEAGIEINRMSVYSEIKLSKLNYETGNLTVRCPTCSDMDFYIKPDPFAIIPSLSLGWQHKISSKVQLKSSIGLQYIKIESAKWKYDSDKFLPFFVKNAVEESISKVNEDLKNVPSIIPTVSLVLSYNF
tara:strand:- start:1570 stop:2277 length:708 start_codon:yes stop_codon:yes gene_type:complete